MLVNPKDLRENVLTGLADQADLRKPIPMVNLQWLGENTSLQAIYSLGPTINRIPDVGSPYFPMPNIGVGTFRQVEKPNTRPDADWGARGAHNFGNLDMSLFWFSHRDRTPYFEAAVASLAPLVTELRAFQERTQVIGGTMTWAGG